MRLRIDNQTDYRTDDIRRLVVLALKEADVWHLPDYLCTVRWAGRAGRCGGYGYIRRREFQITLPRRSSSLAESNAPELSELPPHLVMELAQVAVHEVHHTKGERHGDMAEDVHYWWNMKLPWADGLRVRRRPPKAKPSREEKARAALSRAEVMIAEEEKRHDRRMRALRTKLRKARASVRYYDKKAKSQAGTESVDPTSTASAAVPREPKRGV